MTIVLFIFTLLIFISVLFRTISLAYYDKISVNLRWRFNDGVLYLWGFCGFGFLSYLFFRGKEPLFFFFISTFWLIGYFTVWLVPPHLIEVLVENDLLFNKVKSSQKTSNEQNSNSNSDSI